MQTKVKLENVEIRGCERRISKKEDAREYLLVRFEDETGKPLEIVDRDIEREQYYKRGTIGDIYADLNIGKNFTTIAVIDFKIS